VTKAEKTRQHIIEQTAPVFNCKGFAGTSLADLTEKTGLTKGALYGHFENKEAIAAAAFQYAMTKVRALVRTKVGAYETYQSQLMALLDFYAEYVFEPPVAGGCPLLNAAVEVDDDHLSMRGIVAKEIVQTVEFIETLLVNGKTAGEFKGDTKARELAYTFFCMIEGAIMFSRAERSREPMDIVIAHCKKLLDQITNK
jgi:TetR/AcrR family transcriptional regulator, transcriptional repressor for nem operon